MSGLNVALINNRSDALSYINPVSDAEVVLYDLLSDAEFDAHVVEDQIEDLNDNIAELKQRNKELLDFFNQINNAYNEKIGISNEEVSTYLLDEVLNMIKEAK